jgi:hypothetical protein
MKKILLMFAIIVMMGTMGFAQSFDKGSQAINLGMGFGNTAYHSSHYYGFFPSVSGSYEYGIAKIPMGSKLFGVVSLGGYLGWSASKYDEGWDDVYYRYNTVIIAFRANYHFIFHERFDPYGGIWVGAKINGGKWEGNGNHPDDWEPAKASPVGGAYLGARWFFTDRFAVYSEVGYLISVFNVGVTFKF